ncbi:MAG: hypothetical protein QM778_18760 [Myxococcales bacterium]
MSSARMLLFFALAVGCGNARREAVPARQESPPAEVTHPAPPASELIWEGESAGFHIRWTTSDVLVTQPARGEVFSVAREVRAELEAELAALKAGGGSDWVQGTCNRGSSVVLLSVVGSLLSYREERSTTCPWQAHDFEETFYRTRDLTNGTNASLSSLFPAADVFSALRRDKLVMAALKDGSERPRRLSELVGALAPVYTDTQCFSFPDDVLTRFAFHHLEQDKIAVRIGLPGAGLCRTNLTQLGLLLPVPPSLREALGKAAELREGWLASSLQSIAKGRGTGLSMDATP